jgi:hypothetical protein
VFDWGVSHLYHPKFDSNLTPLESDALSVVDSGYGSARSSSSNFSTPTEGSGLSSARNSPCDIYDQDPQPSQHLFLDPVPSLFEYSSVWPTTITPPDTLNWLPPYPDSFHAHTARLGQFPGAIAVEKKNPDIDNISMELTPDYVPYSSDNKSAITSSNGFNDRYFEQQVVLQSSQIPSRENSSVHDPSISEHSKCIEPIYYGISDSCQEKQEQRTSASETSKPVESSASGSCEQQVVIHSVNISNPARNQLGDIESKLDQLMLLVSGFGCQSPTEDGSEAEEDSESFPWALLTNNDCQCDSGSRSSATSPWITSTSSCQTNSSGASTSTSDGSGSTSPDRSIGGQSSLTSSATKRAYSNDGSPQDDESDDYKKSPKRSPGDVIPESDGSSEKQIPCFVDDCPGKDKHVSEVMSVYFFFSSALY